MANNRMYMVCMACNPVESVDPADFDKASMVVVGKVFSYPWQTNSELVSDLDCFFRDHIGCSPYALKTENGDFGI